MNTQILVVDDDNDIGTVLKDRLELLGHDVSIATDGQRALDAIEREVPGLVLVDLQLPQLSGMDVLNRVTHRWPDVPVLMITAFGTIARAVEAMKAGAEDFITKPIDADHLKMAIAKALERKTLKHEVSVLRREVDSRYPEIIGQSKKMKELLHMAKRVAQADSTVLLLGESGTGKELFARQIHAWSHRADRLFIPVNCGAMPSELIESELFGYEKGAHSTAFQRRPGRFELAHGGTIFLDEVAELAPKTQVKLLRVLQEREFERLGGTRPIRTNIRVIAATNRDLPQAVKTGDFREDLFYRLHVVAFTLPPLRDRQEDIPLLADFFLKKYCKEAKHPRLRLSSHAMEALTDHYWRGNVRELQNAIEKAVVLNSGDRVIRPEDLALQVMAGADELNDETMCLDGPYHETLKSCKKFLICRALRRTGGNVTKTAEMLGVQRTYLARLIKQLQIQ